MTDTATLLLNWYDTHHRILPWRVTPAEQARGITPDPYRVWLSEVMLQQTTVEAVKAYFHKFIKQWPDIAALAGASQDDILRAWAGLGYYSRARNLKACADQIMARHSRVFPRDLAGLRALPGIGDYTAAAIAAIAFNLPHAVVDGNVERVISRLFCITTPLPAAKAEIRRRTQSITPLTRPGDFAQSMMDLGATICTPKRPICFLCPLNAPCLALKNDEPQRLPRKAPKAEKPLRTGAAFVALSENNRIYLQKRPEKGLLGGMSEVPNIFAPNGDKAALSRAPFAADWHYQGDITHVFSHFTLVLAVYRADNLPEHNNTDGWWAAVDKLKEEALPTVIKKAVAQALPTAFHNTKRKPADGNTPIG